MPIDLYYMPGSPPCHKVMLAAKAFNVELNLIVTNLMNGEQFKPEFIKMNPEHTIPTIDDNGFYLGESRAIMMYLAEKYGKDDKWYPRDPQKRAVVNQRLFFDLGTLYQKFSEAYYPVFRAGQLPSEDKLKSFDGSLELLETFLEHSQWVAGDNITIADLAIVCTISAVIEVMEYDMSKFKNIKRWYSQVKSTAPEYKEANEDGLQKFKQFYQQKLQEITK